MTFALEDSGDPVARALAVEIRAELPRHGLDIKGLARAANMDRSVLTTRLTGRTDWRRRELQSVAKALGMSASDLLARAESALERDDAFLALAAGSPPSPSSSSTSGVA